MVILPNDVLFQFVLDSYWRHG